MLVLKPNFSATGYVKCTNINWVIFVEPMPRTKVRALAPIVLILNKLLDTYFIAIIKNIFKIVGNFAQLVELITRRLCKTHIWVVYFVLETFKVFCKISITCLLFTMKTILESFLNTEMCLYKSFWSYINVSVQEVHLKSFERLLKQ